jgi:hypothetical protein
MTDDDDVRVSGPEGIAFDLLSFERVERTLVTVQ